MSLFQHCDDLIVDMTIEILNETIAKQSTKLTAVVEDHKAELEMTLQKSADDIKRLSESHEAVLQWFLKSESCMEENEKKLNSENEKLCRQVGVLKEQLSNQKLLIEKRQEENEVVMNLISDRDFKAQSELLLKEDVINVQGFKITKLKKQLKGEESSTASISAQNFNLLMALNEKTFHLKQTEADLNESHALIASFQNSSSEIETRLLKNLKEMKERISCCFDTIIAYEKDSADLKFAINEFQTEMDSLKHSKAVLNAKVKLSIQ